MHQTQIQKTVQFYGDEIIAVQDGESGVIYVPVGRLCDNLGVNRRNQCGHGFKSVHEGSGIWKGVSKI